MGVTSTQSGRREVNLFLSEKRGLECRIDHLNSKIDLDFSLFRHVTHKQPNLCVWFFHSNLWHLVSPPVRRQQIPSHQPHDLHTNTHIHTYIHKYKHRCTYPHTRTRTHMHAPPPLHTHTHTHTHIHTHAHTHTHIHTHAHTHRLVGVTQCLQINNSVFVAGPHSPNNTKNTVIIPWVKGNIYNQYTKIFTCSLVPKAKMHCHQGA